MVAYDKRLRSIQRQAARVARRLGLLTATHRRLSWYRLVIFFGGFAGALAAAIRNDAWIMWTVIASTVVVFSVLAFYHRRLERAVKRLRIWRDLLIQQRARMQVDWERIAPSTLTASKDHPFALDLDLVGPRSLGQLLDLGVSRQGTERLGEWLMAPEVQPEKIFRRQRLIRELIPLSRFRNRLLINLRMVSPDRLEGDRLLGWIDQLPQTREIRTPLRLAILLTLANLCLVLLSLLIRFPPLWEASFLVYLVFYFGQVKTIRPLLEAGILLDDELVKFKTLLRFLERYPYREASGLSELCQPFRRGQESPSRLLRRVKRVTTAAGLRMNPVLAILLNLFIPWDFLCAHWMARSRDRLRERLPLWFDRWCDLEALMCLANFGYLNPDYPFPRLSHSAGDPVTLTGERVGHPLIPRDRKVCNDFQLGASRIIILTGSNMSGKSTFMKTLGVNLALAFAGAPVNAMAFQTPFYRLFACVRIHDSIADGISTFYAEVKRLKALLLALDQAALFPVFYMIDEIFRGTNNRERLIGSRAYIRSLLDRNGVGLVTTHDLELVQLADERPGIENLHFRESVVDHRMIFDYRLRPGPCPTTNALKIMELEGLPVSPAESG